MALLPESFQEAEVACLFLEIMGIKEEPSGLTPLKRRRASRCTLPSSPGPARGAAAGRAALQSKHTHQRHPRLPVLHLRPVVREAMPACTQHLEGWANTVPLNPTLPPCSGAREAANPRQDAQQGRGPCLHPPESCRRRGEGLCHRRAPLRDRNAELGESTPGSAEGRRPSEPSPPAFSGRECPVSGGRQGWLDSQAARRL